MQNTQRLTGDNRGTKDWSWTSRGSPANWRELTVAAGSYLLVAFSCPFFAVSFLVVHIKGR